MRFSLPLDGAGLGPAEPSREVRGFAGLRGLHRSPERTLSARGQLPISLPQRRRSTAAAVSRTVLAVVIVLGVRASTAAASPLDDPFVGGLGFDGPTAATLASIYWNPAALGLVRGSQVMIAASGHLARTGVTMNGSPTVTARDFSQPFQWPPGPGSYLAVSTDLGGDRFALGFATYMPFVEEVHFPLSAMGLHDEPTRYHALTLDLRNLALVPALSIRFGNDFRIGLAPGFLFSTGHLTFDEDTGTNPQADPSAAARYDIDSGNGLGNARFSVTLGAGLYFRRRSFEAGISYQSRPLASDVTGVEVAGTAIVTTPTGSPSAGAELTCGNNQPSNRCVFGDISYRLPDVWIAGIGWRIRPGLELNATARWLWLHVHDRIDVRLVSPALDATGLPQHIVLYRGFHDVWDTRVGLSYWWRERLRVGATLRFETSAVDSDAVNPGAVDGLKLEPIGLVQVRIGKKLWLGGGYGITIMPAVDVTTSVFNQSAAAGCALKNGDLDDASCRAVLAGKARPSADGHYTYFAQDFGVTLSARF